MSSEDLPYKASDWVETLDWAVTAWSGEDGPRHPGELILMFVKGIEQIDEQGKLLLRRAQAAVSVGAEMPKEDMAAVTEMVANTFLLAGSVAMLLKITPPEETPSDEAVPDPS